MNAQPILVDNDSNLPTATAEMQSKDACRLIALTNDPALIRALRDLSATGSFVSIVTDLRSMTDELLQHSGATALIDATAVDTPIEATVDAITSQLPDLCLMVAGHGPDQQVLASRISSQAVFRFVHKPASPQRLKLFLDAAARPSTPKSNVAVATTVESKEPLSRLDAAVGGKSPRLFAGIGIAFIGAVAAAAWIFWPDENSTANAINNPATTNPATANPAVAALIAQADIALAQSRLVASDGSSAAELYRSALRLDPTSQLARSGYDRAIDQGIRRAEESLLAGKLKEASVIAESVRLIAPENSRLSFLNTQITREQARLNSDASQRQTFEANQARIRSLLATMQDRLQRGALLDPADKNAVTSFREAESISVNDSGVRESRDKLVAALLNAADSALGAANLASAKRLMGAAGSINSNAPGLDVLRRRTEEVSAKTAAADTARVASVPVAPATPVAPVAPTAEPPVVANTPAPATTPAAAANPGNEVVSAGKLRLLRREDPIYPERALEQMTSGWVEMEFTVMQDGSVKDIIVTDAEPRKTFNAAATSALARYRYAPVIRDGAPVKQRARIRIRFTAE